MNSAASLWAYAVHQWGILLPAWASYIGGVIIALVFWKHCPLPAFFTVLAMLVLAFTAAAYPLIASHVSGVRIAQHWTSAQYDYRMTDLGTAFSLIRAIGTSLLLAAIFTGRRATGPVHPPLPTDPRLP